MPSRPVPDESVELRRGQLRHYLWVCIRHDLIRERKPRYAWNHFWTQRWFWSAGRLGGAPVGYSVNYWETPDQSKGER